MIFLLIILSSCTLGTDVPSLPPSISSEQKAQIDSLVEAAIQDGPIASLGIGIQFNGETSLTQVVGMADIAANGSAEPGLVYQIGSLTKTFTAVSIMMIVQEADITLDESITTYIPALPTDAASISIRHLLSHTSGLPNLEATNLEIDYSYAYQPGEVIALLAEHFPELKFEPGTQFHYSNLGYFLLGAAIEEVTGLSYYSYLQTHILDPLNLEHTGACDSELGQIAQGHNVSGQDLIPAPSSNLSLAYSAGGLCSNVDDVLHWYTSLSSGDVIDQSLFDEMIEPVVLPNGTTLQSGFGFIVGDFLGEQAIGHIGRTSGFESFLVHFTDEGLTIVVLSNTNPMDPYALTTLISSIREVASN
jgi:CubicO group peptidase (beta-lactamase class C family)